jgi:hypothetical protein
MACFAKQCVAREEAALRGIGDALQRIRNEEDGEVDTQCDEVVAICCHHIASVYGIYGTEAVIAIQWLCNPQHDQTPESVAAFVADEGLNETLQWFRLHYSKKMLQYMKTIDPQDTIIVNNVRSQHLDLTLFMKLINMCHSRRSRLLQEIQNTMKWQVLRFWKVLITL